MKSKEAKTAPHIFRVIRVFVFVYIFLVSISLMSHAFKGFGTPFAEALISTTSNPFIGLFIGILATSIIQSSSTTTSMVVAFVASGVLSVRGAVPIIMGANIGTTVTNTLVALGHITRKEEFKRAFSGSTMHDFFNIFTVLILFPIEMATHFLEKAGIFLAGIFCDMGYLKFTSPIKFVVKPAVYFVDGLVGRLMPASGVLSYIVILVVAVILLFLALYNIVNITRSLVAEKADMLFSKVIRKTALLSLLMGMLFTAIVQSSSITTSLLVPLIAAGVLELEHAFPIVLGANVGTTITAILASFTGNIAGITIAFVHLAFNVTGILIIYPIKQVRMIPLKVARFVSEKFSKRKVLAVAYVLFIFYLLPISLILLSKIVWKK
ncbi:MAG: Na/Pi symporter [Omnitrophica bacterium]|nr:Na/Pi symporter [Candidatus Omnitrophota bacterium]